MHMITNLSLLLPFNKIALTIVAILMAFWLSACSVTPLSTSVVQPDQRDSSVTTNTATTHKNDPFSYQACIYPPNEMVRACTAKGGAFSQQGRLGCYQCVVTYIDAGKACQDSTDCQGKCKNTGEFIKSGTKNQSGQCASDSSGFGCYQTIEKGVAQPAICVD
ncbi:hypothetical protein FQ082_00740 [Psychrobacter sp. ANT_H56B]|uniref:hypothetical protein n=1 Tax=Psychrobacter sp. ANT_H56B TaxID=2597353 RepID=UPI0011F1C466|nr:hypothetical protein [Psychrobacter sp. ANT_H56B]KAA0929285.1 hypothetical protein FQ082_00740 [Psychrobacter sp. ANT_H56B]